VFWHFRCFGRKKWQKQCNYLIFIISNRAPRPKRHPRNPAPTPTNKLTPPEKGTETHKRWSAIHRAQPDELRWQIRSKTSPGIASAMADQWGRHAIGQDPNSSKPKLRIDAANSAAAQENYN